MCWQIILSPRASLPCQLALFSPLLLPLMCFLRGARISIQPTDSKAHVWLAIPHTSISVKLTLSCWIWSKVKPQIICLLFFFEFYRMCPSRTQLPPTLFTGIVGHHTYGTSPSRLIDHQ